MARCELNRQTDNRIPANPVCRKLVVDADWSHQLRVSEAVAMQCVPIAA